MLSVITPVHKTSEPYLVEAGQSLKDQTCQDWEWIIVPNGGATVPESIANDERVIVAPVDDDKDVPHNRVGRIKRFAAERASGDIIVELDADDQLTPNALDLIAQAFADHPQVQMVYSNSASFEQDTWKSEGYSEYWGWRSRPFDWQGHPLKEMIAWPAGPQMMRRIEWAPNHVRAWRASSYWALDGHNPKLLSADDHDLCCRFYILFGAAGFHHIDECLYVYRVHGANTCTVFNDAVQAQTARNYVAYRVPMACRWARDNGLQIIDLGGRLNSVPGFRTVDLADADIIADLNGHWPFEDGSVGVLRSSNVFEHLRDPIHTMNEAYRVLAPGGFLFIEVPSTDGRGAFQDPGHVSFWNSNSFWYYTQRDYSKYIPLYKGRFQMAYTETGYPSEWAKNNFIAFTIADLIALKAPYDERPVGEVLI